MRSVKTSLQRKLRLFWGLAFFLIGSFFHSPQRLRADLESYDARPSFVRPGGIILFFNSKAPLSFETPTRREIPPDAQDIGTVKCKTCQHGVSIPLFGANGSRSSSLSGGAGDGGFEKTLKKLQGERPELRGIYDVKVDLQHTSILGIYRRLCTEVTARGFK